MMQARHFSSIPGFVVAATLAAFLPSPTWADPTDSLPAACSGVFDGFVFPAGVSQWDGTDEAGGFSDEGGGSFHHAPNWFPGHGVPGATSGARFGGHPCLDLPGGQTVALGDFSGPQDPSATPGQDAEIATLDVASGSFSLDLGGQQLLVSAPGFGPKANLTIGSPNLLDGTPGTAELAVSGGGTLTTVTNLQVGGTDQHGTLRLSGAGTRLVVQSGFVGLARAIVGGSSSDPGSGLLVVEDGAELEVELGFASLLNFSGNASAEVRGVGSRIFAGDISVGSSVAPPGGPTPSLLVEAGASLEADEFDVTGNGVITLRGSGTTAQTRVFQAHTSGSLSIEDGASLVATDRAELFRGGRLQVSGASSRFETDRLEIGLEEQIGHSSCVFARGPGMGVMTTP